MATKCEQTFSIDAPPDEVVRAISNPALIEESERSRQALDVKVTELSRSETALRYEVYTMTYSRGVTGIDKSKTDENRNTIEWDLKARAGTWNWRGPHGEKVKVSGGYTVTPDGAGSRLKLHVAVDVRFPMVGGVVERKVKEGFEKGWPAYVELVRKYARKG